MTVVRTRRVRGGEDSATNPSSEVARQDANAASKVNFPSPPDEPARVEAPRQPTSLGPAWGMVVEDVYRLDVWPVYERLRDGLRDGDGNEYATVLRALDRASQNLFNAYRLHGAAILEAAREEREADAEMEILRTTARAELQAEAASGKRKGVVTKDEVADRCLANWPEQARALLGRRERAKQTAEIMGGLVEAWKRRHQALDAKARRAADAAGR